MRFFHAAVITSSLVSSRFPPLSLVVRMGSTDHLPSIQADQPPPPRLTSFDQIVRWRAERGSEQLAYTFLVPGRGEVQSVSYGDLDRQVRAVAAALVASGKRGQRVLIVQQPGLEYITSLFACMYAGMVAVPVYPLDGFRLQHTLPRLQAITRDADAAILLTSGAALLAGTSTNEDAVTGPLGDLCRQAVLRTDRIDAGLAESYRSVETHRNDLAILQYTSGTTGQPRGVALQHRHLLANAQQIYGAYHVPDAVCVFWLPPYHDMGLVGGLLLPMFAGRRSVLMSPTSFVQQPAAWLQAISDYRGTTTASPNFGYELCLRKVGDEVLESLDLSSLRVAISGAEPIRAATLRRFAERFSVCGLRSSALTPAYGMAEATLAITGKPLGDEPVAIAFDARQLQENRAVPTTSPQPTGSDQVSRLVGCGWPLSGTEVQIVDPDTREPLEAGRVGEIWVRGAAVASGYWQQEALSQATFAATLADLPISLSPTAPPTAPPVGAPGSEFDRGAIDHPLSPTAPPIGVQGSEFDRGAGDHPTSPTAPPVGAPRSEFDRGASDHPTSPTAPPVGVPGPGFDRGASDHPTSPTAPPVGVQDSEFDRGAGDHPTSPTAPPVGAPGSEFDRGASDPIGAPYLRTGDLGFIHDEQLFVSGRLKDLIIIAGRNYFAHELEAAIQTAHEALKVDGGVAFSCSAEDGREGDDERLIIVQEVLRPKRYALSELVDQVRATLAEQFELSPDAVLLVPAGSLSKTSSGKLQRSECARRYLQHELQPLLAWNRDNQQADSEVSGRSSTASVAAPRSEVARALAPLWCEVLELDHAADDQHFLDHGGHSLAAVGLLSRIRDRLGVTLPWETLFRAPRFGQLVSELEQLAAATSEAISDAGIATPVPTAGQPFPLTSAQRRFWLLDQLEWQQAFLHVEATLRIGGELDRGRLAEVVRGLPQRHPALRLRFDIDSLGVPFQRVVADADLEVQRVDLCGLSAPLQREQFSRLRAEAAQARFDLQHGPVARAVIVRLSRDETALIFAAHHLVCDGSSVMLLMEDVARQYGGDQASESGSQVEAKAPRWSWAEAFGKQLQRREDSSAGLDYWLERLRDVPAESPLAIGPPATAPCDASRADTPSRLQQLRLPYEVAERLDLRSRQWQVTPLEILLAAWHIVLRRCSDHDDIVLGVPVAGRDQVSLEHQVGCFINTLPVRLSGTDQETFAQYVSRVSQQWRRDVNHAAVPLDEIIDALSLPRVAGRLPLIQHLVLHQPPVRKTLRFGASECTNFSSDYSTLGAYDTALICQPYRDTARDAGGASGAAPETSGGWQYDLGIAYAPGRVAEVAAENLLAGLVELLDQGLKSPDQQLTELSTRGPCERERVAAACSPRREHQLCETVLEMFARRVAQTPDQVVIQDAAGSSTFAQLDQTSTELARELVRSGVEPGTFVALRLGRSRRIIESALAVWKAGAAYLPLDPDYPPQRIDDILTDARPACLIEEHLSAGGKSAVKVVSTAWSIAPRSNAEPAAPTGGAVGDSGWSIAPRSNSGPKTPTGGAVGDNGWSIAPRSNSGLAAPTGGAVGDIEWSIAPRSNPGLAAPTGGAVGDKAVGDKAVGDNAVGDIELPGASLTGLAYLIYTSGSTGKPKGVMVGHDNLANLLLSFATTPGLAAGERILAATTMSFDISILELFLPLVTGATAVMTPRSLSEDPDAVLNWIEHHRIDVIQATPSSLRMMLASGWRPATDQTIWCGGEPLQLDLAERIAASGAKLWNLYGPTETTVWSLACEISSPVTPPISIGRPIDSTTIRIADAQGRIASEGVAGELWIGGQGVARGYWNRPELTAERFIDVAGQGRMYRTGDRVRRRTDGVLEFLGRVDRQIKLRGHRVELGEIEAALNRSAGVAESAVVCIDRSETDQRLVAFFRPDVSRTVETDELRSSLVKRLPPHMVPAALIPLSEIPHTPAGKIDYQRLPDAGERLAAAAACEHNASHTQPLSETEQRVVAIWQEVLGIDNVAIDDNFFHLGGHSLMAAQVFSRLRTQLGVQLPLREIYAHPTVAALAGLVDDARGAAEIDSAAIESAGEKQAPANDSLAGFLASRRKDTFSSDDALLSPAEQRLWFVDQLEPEHPFYNLPLAARIDGPLDFHLLGHSLNACVARHDTLRSTYRVVEGQPRRHVAQQMTVEPQRIDLRGDRHAAAKLPKLLAEEARRPFDLTRGPLLRVVCWRLSQDEHVILLVMHHIVSDGWSMGVMLRELTEHYRAAGAGTAPQLPPLGASYPEYAAWQQQALTAARIAPTLDYWRKTLDGAIETLDLPIDFPRPLVQSFEGARLAIELPAELSSQIDALASNLGVTPYSVLLASYSLLLSRLSRQRDVSIGTAVANRPDPLVEDLIGFFVNTVVVRQRSAGTETFEQWIQQTHAVAAEAIEHQEVPFEQVVQHLAKHRDRGHSPLFQAAFILQNAPVPLDVAPGLTLVPLEVDNATAKYDLTLTLSQRDGAYQGHFEYRTSLLRGQTVQRFRDCWLTLLSTALPAPETPIDKLPLVSPQAQADIVARGNGPALLSGSAPILHERIATAAQRYPAAMAICQRDRFVTYAELHQSVLRIAHGLQQAGVKRGDRVLVYLPRSIDQIASTLAVMRCGAAFCPVDTQVPLGRVQAIAAELQPAAVITETTLVTEVDAALSGRSVCRSAAQFAAASGDDWQDVPVSPHDLAYLIFTSGSTGVPKGVAVEHRTVCNFADGFALALQLKPGLRCSHLFSPSFDGAIGEIFPVLASGGCLEVIDQVTALDPAALSDDLSERGVEFLSATPATLAMLDPARLPGVRKVLSAGAMLTGELAARWMKRHRVYNGYGPTECTVGASFARLDDSDLPAPSVGRPLPNCRLYVLDPQRQLVPDGVIGEVYIGGAGVARGYWRRDEQTAQAFMVDPFASATGVGEPLPRMYRTGDLGRWNRAGRLEIVGRNDEQIKLRGFRIEPGEIAAVLDQLPGVRQSAVIVHSTGESQAAQQASDQHDNRDQHDQRLVAYVVAEAADEGASRPQEQTHSDEHDQVENWRLLFDQSHQPAPVGIDPADDFSGWTSVITGKPIPLNSMRRWADAAASRIAELQPRRMLEIGCGSGLMLLRLTDHFEHYTGIDIHHAALEQLRAAVSKRPLLRDRVTLLQRTADQLDELAVGSFDTIVLNSVVQYFPSATYLLRVLRGAQRLLAPGGKLFLGDLRNLRLHEALAVAAELHRCGNAPLSAGQFRRRVCNRMAHDEELLVDPDLLPHLKPQLERLAGVRTQVKTADNDSELNRFRFDAVLYFDEAPAATGADAAASLHVCNGNVHREVVVSRLLSAADDRDTLGDVLQLAEAALQPQASPSVMAAAAAAAGLQLDIDWHPQAIDWLSVTGRRGGRALSPAELAEQLMVVPVAEPAPAVSRDRRWTSQPGARRRLMQLVERMRTELRQRLPAYMVPSSFVLVDELPLTIQGKLDRAALPPPPTERLSFSMPPREPQTQTQRVLVEIWEELLEISPIGIDDDFFDLGGHSMLAVRMVAQVRQRLGRTLPLAALFGKPTIAQLAKLLDKPASSRTTALVPLTLSGSEQPLFCIHPAGGTVFCYQELANCFANRRPVFGLQARGVDGLEKPHATLREMAAHYAAAIRAALRQGPVHLVGWSLGGNIAYEVARQLAKSGREVGVLALLDSGVLAAQEGWSEQDFLPLIAALFPGQQHASLEALRQASPEEQLAYFIRQAARAGIVPQDPSETGTHIFDVFQANVKAVHDHRPQPYSGSLLLVRPADQMRTGELFDDQMLGWDAYADRIELARVPGDHAHMLQRPAVLEIAAELEKRLSPYSAARRSRRMVARF